LNLEMEHATWSHDLARARIHTRTHVPKLNKDQLMEHHVIFLDTDLLQYRKICFH
jgi:hypothetical protein